MNAKPNPIPAAYRWTLGAMIALAIVTIPMLHYRWQYVTSKRLRVVEEGKLYRSGIMTVEGLEQAGALDPIQEGFVQEHGLQCGFCTPGMMMTSYALLKRNPHPDENQIRWAISGNLCRCTGYVNIVKSVQHAATKIAAGGA